MLLSFLAVMLAVIGTYSILTDLYLRDRERIDSESTMNFANDNEIVLASRRCSNHWANWRQRPWRTTMHRAASAPASR